MTAVSGGFLDIGIIVLLLKKYMDRIVEDFVLIALHDHVIRSTKYGITLMSKGST